MWGDRIHAAVSPPPVAPRRVGDSDVLRHGDVYSGLFQKTSICEPIEDRADGDKGFQTGVYERRPFFCLCLQEGPEETV